GTEMIVWGGRTSLTSNSVVDTGGRLGSAWNATSATNAPTARAQHTAVWTGREMIVFGGFDSTGSPLASRARYNPATDHWTTLPSGGSAPSARGNHSAVWTGQYMIIWGGEGSSGNQRATGARYDPAVDRWSSIDPSGPARSFLMSAWTGSKWLLY